MVNIRIAFETVKKKKNTDNRYWSLILIGLGQSLDIYYG